MARVRFPPMRMCESSRAFVPESVLQVIPRARILAAVGFERKLINPVHIGGVRDLAELDDQIVAQLHHECVYVGIRTDGGVRVLFARDEVANPVVAVREPPRLGTEDEASPGYLIHVLAPEIEPTLIRLT